MDPITIGLGILALGLARSWWKAPEQLAKEIDRGCKEDRENNQVPDDYGW